jgi:hypothetical protein
MTAADVLGFWTHKTWNSSLIYDGFDVSYIKVSQQFKVTKLYVALNIPRIITSVFLCVNLKDFVLLLHIACTFSSQYQKKSKKLCRLTSIPQRTQSHVLCVDITVHSVM